MRLKTLEIFLRGKEMGTVFLDEGHGLRVSGGDNLKKNRLCNRKQFIQCSNPGKAFEFLCNQEEPCVRILQKSIFYFISFVSCSIKKLALFKLNSMPSAKSSPMTCLVTCNSLQIKNKRVRVELAHRESRTKLILNNLFQLN